MKINIIKNDNNKLNKLIYLDRAKMTLEVVVILDVKEHATHEFIVKARCPFILDGEPFLVQMFQNLNMRKIRC
jgi:hypothetical protein